MEKKFEQVILYDKIKYNYYTIDELNKKIIERSKIIDSYNEIEIEDRIYRNTESNLYGDEEWKISPERPGIEVSNYGRIKIGGKIWKQRDVKHKIGYLILDDFRTVPEKYKEYLLQFKYVYNLVARIWLGRHIENGYSWDVHHITNKGYDNRPVNLIWIKRCDHNKIEHKSTKKTV